ncbi:AAA family ATPase [Roseomonas elaeocarpi]|uniref:AAA family ATPase n=1 Tax=Roseomonas elaeocarpi TaxID=907779 RepID=A0ABV6JPF9_9PROT
MRLTSLSLRRYGPFEDATLRFDPAPGRINLVLAPNGTGKSVLRQAFADLLFGIGAQTPMGFRHGYAGMQLSATGIGADGTGFAFTRRKGNKNTLAGEGDAPLDQAWLDRLLGRADAKLLAQLFALDTERLRQGGRDLLSSGGVLADALLAAAGGLREASALRRTLEAERDALAPLRRTATRPFYVALDRWNESRRQLRESLVRPREWAEREKILRDAEAARDESNRAAAEAGVQLRRLERIRRTRPLLAAQAMATAWLRENPDAPHLPPELAGRLPAARGAVAQAGHNLGAARASLAQLEEDIAALVADDALLQAAGEIGRLTGMAALVEQAVAGLPGTEAELAAMRDRVAAQAGALCHPDHDAAALIPAPALVAQLRRLAAEHAAREATLAALPRRAREQRARLEEAERALAALPPAEDMHRLENLLADIRREGDPARLLAAAGRGVAEAEAQHAMLLARLPVPLRAPEALVTLDPPAMAMLDRLAEAREAAQRALERQDEVVQRHRESLAATGAERAALEAGGAPPTPEALAGARAHREAGWNLVFRQLSGEGPDPEGEQRYGGTRPLALAYAEAVAAADRIADARWADAERATRAERLLHQQARQEAEFAAATQARAIAKETCGAAEAAWGAAIRPLGLDAGSGPAEAERVLTARDAGLSAGQALLVSRAALTELRARQEDAAARLRRLLGSGGSDTGAPALSALMDEADGVVRQRQATGERRRAHEAAATAARDALREIEGEREVAAQALRRWQNEWSAALTALGQAPDLPPGALDEVLDAYDSLGESLHEAAALAERAGAWREGVERFRSGYAALCERLGTARDPDALSGLGELDRRQRAEAALAERRAALLDQREKALAALRQHEQALAAAEAALRAAIAEAGATTAEAAEARIALAAERARQEGLLRAAEVDLLAAGGGIGLEALRAEAAAQPADALEDALQEAESAQQHHVAAAQAQVATVTALELELRQLAGDEAAVRAAAGEAAAAGQLGQTLDDALLMQVAVGLLDAALGAVQEGGNDVLLGRIGAGFAELTEGTYTGVSSREDERGVARLVLRTRDFPDEEVEVEQLSEGTRDQLFLALRLVAIADQAVSGTVLPFVGDDILQSFDDRRAAAAFQSLLRLSETTQVILLSHHEHLLGVLERAVAPLDLHLQRVGG